MLQEREAPRVTPPPTISAPAGALPIVATPPEVDELGLPQTILPPSPITTFSWLTFFTTINHLRTLQKILKSHSHRQLLMVQFKYAAVLKRCLKVPQPDIRFYTLKIIKGQVPYYHRKWRQSNMRVITAIYLHCKPSLRDEWLAGVDVEQEVGEAANLEKAGRALAYFYNVRRFENAMGLDLAKERSQESLGKGGVDGDMLTLDLAALSLEADGGADADADACAQEEGQFSRFLPSAEQMSQPQQEDSSQPPIGPSKTTTADLFAFNDDNPADPSRPRASTTTSTSSRSSSKSVLEEAEHDFFVRELERMDMVKDASGFWRLADEFIGPPEISTDIGGSGGGVADGAGGLSNGAGGNAANGGASSANSTANVLSGSGTLTKEQEERFAAIRSGAAAPFRGFSS
jgi:hypothetical protein